MRIQQHSAYRTTLPDCKIGWENVSQNYGGSFSLFVYLRQQKKAGNEKVLNEKRISKDHLQRLRIEKIGGEHHDFGSK